MRYTFAGLFLLAPLVVGSAYADDPSAFIALPTSTHLGTAADYVLNAPLSSASVLNGNMFTNQTEILTPRGIIDEPIRPMTLTRELSTALPDAATIAPAAGPLEMTSPTIP